jgi:hypothetical protein
MQMGYRSECVISQNGNDLSERYVVVGLAISEACVILAASGSGELKKFGH